MLRNTIIRFLSQRDAKTRGGFTVPSWDRAEGLKGEGSLRSL
jgi:hypothetical protein